MFSASLSLSLFPIYCLELFGDHQRACCHVVQCTSQIVFPGALGGSMKPVRHQGVGSESVGSQCPSPQEKHCFLCFLHVGLPCKMHWREGSSPQTNLSTDVRRLRRHWQHGQRGETGPSASRLGSLAGRKGRLNGSGHSCVCRSGADVSVCSGVPACLRLAWMLPLCSLPPLLTHLVPDELPTWLSVNFCSFPLSLWPGILTCFLL